MDLEFPLSHIENNLLFNVNGDVWCYFKTDIFNLYLLNYNNKDIHVYTSNSFKERMYIVGFKLKEVVGEKTSFKVNLKSFFEGLNSPVNSSVGLNTQSIISDDVIDYLSQTKNIEDFLSKRMEAKPLEPIELIELFQSMMNLEVNSDINIGEQGILNFNNLNIVPYNENTLMLENSYTSEENEKESNISTLYIQHLIVRSIENVEHIISLLEIDFPIFISTRVNSEYGSSIILRIESESYKDLMTKVDKLYNYVELLNINIFTPIGEQFKLFYEGLFGTDKIDNDYFLSLITKEESEVF
ncbi:MAG TPA: hypothetical protein VK121_04635 [Pseudogracilibacillus sp.]|nr:hypothetical protein [Pseudogracilibacillus sp.]